MHGDSIHLLGFGWVAPKGIDRFSCLHLLLREMEPIVSASKRDEGIVIADFGDAAFLEDNDAIGLAERADPVRDRDSGSTLDQDIERFLNLSFGFRVDRRGGFVEDEDPRIGEQGSRDGDTLTLTSRQGLSAFAND